MKHIKYWASLAFVLYAFSPAGAQNIDPTVEITRRYDVDLDAIVKPELPYSYDDSLAQFDIDFDYSIYRRPYKDLYEFNPYETVFLKTKEQEAHPWLYLKAGCQYPLKPSGELYLQWASKKGVYLDFYGKHDSYWGDLPESVDYLGSNINRVGGDFKYAWKSGELTFSAKYDYDRNLYSRQQASMNHGRNALDLSLGVRSANKDADGAYYDFSVIYRNTAGLCTSAGRDSLYNESMNTGQSGDSSSVSFGLTENFFRFKGYVGASFDVHRVYVDMDIKYASYGDVKNYTTGIVEFAPMYEVNKGILHGKFGIRFGNRFGVNNVADTTITSDGNDIKPLTNIFPDIDARILLSRKSLWLHLIVTGGNDLNSYSELLSQMPYLSPSSNLHFGTRPVDVNLSFESVIRGRASFNLLGGYTRYENKALFSPVVTSSNSLPFILSHYHNLNRFFAGAELMWKSQELSTGVSYRWNKYNEAGDSVREITELPAHTVKAFLRYNWRERIVASVDFNWESATSGQEYGSYRVPEIYDLNFNLNYKINRYIAVFVKVGNVLDKRNQYIPLYIEPGRNYGGGICITI